MGAQVQALADNGKLRQHSFKVLLLEDNAIDARWVARGLKQSGGSKYDLHVLDMVDSVEAYLARNPVDVIVMDLNLPDSHGWHTVRQIADAKPGVPIVVLSGQADFDTVREALLAGAQTYQIKDIGSQESLAERIEFAIQRKSREIELAKKFIALPL